MSINAKATRLLFAASFLFALVFGVFSSAAQATPTELTVSNGSNAPVDVWINSNNPPVSDWKATVGGAATNISLPSNFSGTKGVFTLAVGATATLTSKKDNHILNGTITFNCIPVCPCGGAGQPPCPVVSGYNLPSKLINGVNQGEFALNTGFESIDISCVNGSNCQMAIKCTGGTPQWVNNVTKAPVNQFGNGAVDVAKQKDANCNAVGVFTFNTTNCINIAPPVPCQPPVSFCQHPTPDCQLDRKGSGGTINISVLSFEAQ